ncbi:hypothetical protein NDU88_006697 [Pleurodeles waltl]|uniref:Secreted protein n=1 Tax=Pleurodeles waltl TaxID=8319 RepID=A0AAV7LPX2_PLEWA|nr:hypothetical protein NDU88_006697 [Pleurodeles waltl]
MPRCFVGCSVAVVTMGLVLRGPCARRQAWARSAGSAAWNSAGSKASGGCRRPVARSLSTEALVRRFGRRA